MAILQFEYEYRQNGFSTGDKKLFDCNGFSDGIKHGGRLKTLRAHGQHGADKVLRKFAIILAYPCGGQHQIHFAGRFGTNL